MSELRCQNTCPLCVEKGDWYTCEHRREYNALYHTHYIEVHATTGEVVDVQHDWAAPVIPPQTFNTDDSNGSETGASEPAENPMSEEEADSNKEDGKDGKDEKGAEDAEAEWAKKIESFEDMQLAKALEYLQKKIGDKTATAKK